MTRVYKVCAAVFLHTWAAMCPGSRGFFLKLYDMPLSATGDSTGPRVPAVRSAFSSFPGNLFSGESGRGTRPGGGPKSPCFPSCCSIGMGGFQSNGRKGTIFTSSAAASSCLKRPSATGVVGVRGEWPAPRQVCAWLTFGPLHPVCARRQQPGPRCLHPANVGARMASQPSRESSCR